MKKLLSLILCFAILSSVVALLPVTVTAASSGTCGENLTWTLDDEGTLTISGTGEMDDYSWNSAPWSDNSSKIKSIEIGDGVTSIGGFAFDGCTSLTAITIPDSVTSIGEWAFYGCTSLTSIDIPDSVATIRDDVFNNCTALTSIEIPDSVTSIGAYAFYRCTSLTSLSIGNGLTEILSDAFSGCESLTSIVIPNGVITIEGEAFRDCTALTSITIPNGVESIENYTFRNCALLESITIPSSVTSIGDSAFSGCTSLTSIEIPEGVTSIGRAAFSGCDSLNAISLPNTIMFIGEDAFYNCTSLLFNEYQNVNYLGNDSNPYLSLISVSNSWLSSYEISDDTKIIAGSSFSNCSSLTEIVIPEGVIAIGEGAFYRCYSLASVTILGNETSIGQGAFRECSSLTSLTLPDSITKIEYNTFINCSSLTSITIPESVTSIGNSAFSGCSSLLSIYIPENVKEIEIYAFNNCSSLESITVNTGNTVYHSNNNCLIETLSKTLIAGCKNSIIPTDGSVTSIGMYAFSGCNMLTDMVIPSGVESIGNGAFENCKKLSSISLPNEIESISNGAFYGCSSLDDVYFDGDFSEWIELDFDFGSAEIHVSGSMVLTGECGDNLVWDVDVSTGELTISGTGDMYDYGTHYSGWYTYTDAPWGIYTDYINYVTITDGVTSISPYAFYNLDHIYSIDIGSNVSSIGYHAFSNCSYLNQLTVNNNNAKYHSDSNCIIETSTKKLVAGCSASVIPTDGSVTIIGDNAFYEVSINEVVIPESVVTIETEAFYNASVKSIEIEGNNLKRIEQFAFNNCGIELIILPKSLESIGYNSFSRIGYILFKGTNEQWNNINEYGYPVAEEAAFVFCGCEEIPDPVNPLTVNGIEITKNAIIYTNGHGPTTGGGGRTYVLTDGSMATYVDTCFDTPNEGSDVSVSFAESKIDKIVLTIARETYVEDGIIFKSNDSVHVPVSVDYYYDPLLNNAFCAEFTFEPFITSNVTIYSFPGKLYELRIISNYSDLFEGSCGDELTWKFSEESKTLTISGTGEMYDYNDTAAPWGSLQIETIIVEDGVTSIGDSAFASCRELKETYLPASIESVYYSSFGGKIIHYDGTESDWYRINKNGGNFGTVTAFESIIIDYIKSGGIPKSYRVYDPGMQSFTVDTESGTATVTGIGGLYSYSPNSMPTVSYMGPPKWEKYGFFIKKADIQQGVTRISENAFLGCNYLEEINIPNSVYSIADNAFSGCKSLLYTRYDNAMYLGNDENPYYALIKPVNYDITSCTIHEKTEIIANCAFKGCSKITNLVLPASIKAIGYGAFDDCSRLQLIRYDNGLYLGSANNQYYALIYSLNSDIKSCVINAETRVIAGGAFENCTRLKSIDFPNQIVSIGDRAFYNCSLRHLVIPDNIVYFGNKAFSYCRYLTDVTIGNGIEVIETSAFEDDNGLCSITGGNNLKAIGSLAMASTGFESVELPEGIQAVGYQAFYNMERQYKKIEIPSTMNTIGENAFGRSLYSTEIYYGGSKRSWIRLKDNSGYNYSLFENQNVVFSDSTNYCGENITWTIDNNGALVITGTGDMYDFDSWGDDAAPWYDLSDRIVSVSISEGVTSIGDFAFYECYSLTSITIPDSVTSIGDGTFYYCASLTSVTIGSGVTSIGYNAFFSCTSLTSITIPDSVTMIKPGAFAGCSSLESIIVDEGNTVYHSDNNCLIETESKTLIAGCKNSIIPSDGSVTSIGDNAFYGCTALTSVTIPDSVISIGYCALGDCLSLTSITIPESVMSIEEYAFDGCGSLESITVDEGNTVYHSDNNCLIETGSKVLIRGCNNSIIPSDDSVTSIGDSAFSGCTSLTSVTIPEGVTSIGRSAFSGCTALTSVTIPDSVTSIGNWAFEDCTSLTDIYYTGSEEDWNDIEIGKSFDGNAPLLNATIHYNYVPTPLVSVVCNGVEKGQYAPGEEIELPVPETIFDNGAVMRFFGWLGAEVTRSAYSSENGTSNGRSYTMTVPDHDVELTPEYVLVGDLTGDGMITIRDLAAMKTMIAGGGEWDEQSLEAADINFDGLNSLYDISKFKSMLAGGYTPVG